MKTKNVASTPPRIETARRDSMLIAENDNTADVSITSIFPRGLIRDSQIKYVFAGFLAVLGRLRSAVSSLSYRKLYVRDDIPKDGLNPPRPEYD